MNPSLDTRKAWTPKSLKAAECAEKGISASSAIFGAFRVQH